MPDRETFEDALREIRLVTDRWIRPFTILVTVVTVPFALLFLLPALLGLFAAPPDPGTDLYAVNRPLAFTFLDADGNDVGHRGAVVGERLAATEGRAVIVEGLPTG